MGDQLDVDAMLRRFRERAEAVKGRPLPPVAGADRQRFVEQAQLDFQDFAIVADADWSFDDGVSRSPSTCGPLGGGLGPSSAFVVPSVVSRTGRPSHGSSTIDASTAGITAVGEGARARRASSAVDDARSSGRCRGRTPPPSTRSTALPS